jgi:hypothetical protein
MGLAASEKKTDGIIQQLKKIQSRLGKNPWVPYIFVGLNIALSLFINIFANKLDLMLGPWSMAGLAALIVILLVALVRLAYAVAEGQLPEEIEMGRYSSLWVNSPSLIDAANKISQNAFKDDNPPDEKVHRILLKNKKACFGLLEADENGNEVLVGYASCWPITREVANRLRLGEGEPGGLSERNFTEEHILSDAEVDEKAEYLFVPAVAVLDPEEFRGQVRAIVLAFEWVDHIRKTYAHAASKRKLGLFLVGTSRAGQKMTRRIAGHLGLTEPTGYLTLYSKREPYYDTEVNSENWSSTMERTQLRLFRTWYRIAKRDQTR